MHVVAGNAADSATDKVVLEIAVGATEIADRTLIRRITVSFAVSDTPVGAEIAEEVLAIRLRLPDLPLEPFKFFTTNFTVFLLEE